MQQRVIQVARCQVLTQTAAERNTSTCRAFLETLDYAYLQDELNLFADNLASQLSALIQDWLADHQRMQHAFIPVGAA